MAPTNDRTRVLTTEQVLLIHASLEPAAIRQSFQNVCVEHFGPSEVRVFTFLPDDPTHMLPFGWGEEPKPLSAPEFDGPGFFGAAATPIEGTEAPGQWCALLPLTVDADAVGVLQVMCEHAVDRSGVALLQELARALAMAVRNAGTFEKTRRLTFTDDLTALYNSRFMALYLDRELKRCRRMKSPLSLLFMDLDGFKEVNDTHGHLAGSRTLVEVGGVLEETVRDADILIRYGGDEFVILFPETPLSGGMVIAERIRQVIGNTKFLESMGIEGRVTASIGIAAYPESADDVRSLITSADRAMYEAKALGKNRVVAARPITFPLALTEPTKRP
ncbi:MAG TPA: GGDEF domain-containing protein [Vicinamibacteria bacterium]|nr:GGDEF domain-containing protein [Vicinamibacteria bacterium]